MFVAFDNECFNPDKVFAIILCERNNKVNANIYFEDFKREIESSKLDMATIMRQFDFKLPKAADFLKISDNSNIVYVPVRAVQTIEVHKIDSTRYNVCLRVQNVSNKLESHNCSLCVLRVSDDGTSLERLHFETYLELLNKPNKVSINKPVLDAEATPSKEPVKQPIITEKTDDLYNFLYN